MDSCGISPNTAISITGLTTSGSLVSIPYTPKLFGVSWENILVIYAYGCI